MPKTYDCPMPGCAEQATYVRFAAEEIFSKNVEPIDISTLQGVARNIVVRCPIHGEKIIQVFGHHIDTPGPFRGAKVGGRWQTKPGRQKKR